MNAHPADIPEPLAERLEQFADSLMAVDVEAIDRQVQRLLRLKELVLRLKGASVAVRPAPVPERKPDPPKPDRRPTDPGRRYQGFWSNSIRTALKALGVPSTVRQIADKIKELGLVMPNEMNVPGLVSAAVGNRGNADVFRRAGDNADGRQLWGLREWRPEQTPSSVPVPTPEPGPEAVA